VGPPPFLQEDENKRERVSEEEGTQRKGTEKGTNTDRGGEGDSSEGGPRTSCSIQRRAGRRVV